jgi:hypothetical protein
MDAEELLRELTTLRQTLQLGLIKAREELDGKARRIETYIEGTKVVRDVDERYPLYPLTE